MRYLSAIVTAYILFTLCESNDIMSADISNTHSKASIDIFILYSATQLLLIPENFKNILLRCST